MSSEQVPLTPGSNAYDFLKDTPPPPKKSIFPSGNTQLQRILVIVGLLVFLLIGFAVVKSILGNAGKENTVELMDIAKQQAELIRIASLGVDGATDRSTKNLAITTKLILSSDQPALLKSIAGATGVKKIDPKSLVVKSNSTDSTLKLATQSNKFDDVFTQTLIEKMGTYQKALKKAYPAAISKSLKTILSASYDHVSSILGNTQP